MENLTFKFLSAGHYLVIYTTPVRGLEYHKTITDMTLIDATKNTDCPTKKAAKELINAIKR